MKIVVVGSTQGKGGLHTHFRLLLEFLVAEKHDVMAIGIGDTASETLAAEGIREAHCVSHHAPGLVDKVRKYLQMRRSIIAAVRFAPDLFVAAGMGNGYARIARGIGPRAFRFYQEVIHTALPYKQRLNLLDAVDAVAVQSPMMCRSYRAHITTTKPVGCLPCFAEVLPGAHLARLPAPGDALRFAYFGRLAENKGLCELVRAIAKVRDQINATLDIHGEGAERASIEAAIRQAGMEDSIRVCGTYPGGAAYPEMLSSYHALLLPSMWGEGLPLILLEAMSVGLPFLGTRIGAIPDAAVDNPDAMIVEPDEAGMAEGLVRMASALREGRISNARARSLYERKFSMPGMAAEWRKMLADPRGYFESGVSQ
ncbi:MAG: glycosyltransferase family 4 protein [Chthoniobacteraceae bacterium]